MAVGAGYRSQISTSLLVLFLALLCGTPRPAQAVVVEGLNVVLPPPNGGWVGNWYGSSGVPISPHWFITARHVGGVVGMGFLLRGVQYQAVEIVVHPSLDLQLVRVASPMPGWHAIAPQPAAGTQVYLGGCGATTLQPLPGNLGWDWGGQHFEAWGRNTIETTGAMLRIRFDAPASQGAVPQEAAFAVNDSGAGLFVVGPGGVLQLAGTAVSVSGAGSSAYGSSSYCVTLQNVTDWINGNTGGTTPPPMNCNLFEFLSAWFARSPAADFDGNQLIEATDIFAYLAAWFAGCHQ